MTYRRHRTFVFDTTNAALWAEEVACAAGLAVEVVPAPAASRAKCDLALVTPAECASRVEEALDTAGVSYRRWPPAVEDPSP
jgi:hypothetical protein